MTYEEIITECKRIYAINDLGVSDRSKFKWVLGANIIYTLASAANSELIHNSETPSTLFGIDVIKDYYNTTRIELWKKCNRE